ncbi:MAG: sulfurtransferase [Gemmatimonadota bacterium]|nr:sulfurtransferase [Gemmatimonadota bacterium]MDE2986323.1 sulfurtransferase [Gemmatimonadota bacterium]
MRRKPEPVTIGSMATSGDDPQTTVPGPAATAGWLAADPGRPGLVVLDGSWYLPGSGRDPKLEFEERRIPGARFFDIDMCSDPGAELPHTIPPPGHFRKCAEEAGVSDRSAVIVYDGSGVNLSAARVWWTFRYFGHDNVAVLDGGLKHWIASGLPTESGPPVRTLEAPAPFTPRPRPHLVRTAEDVLAAIGSAHTQIVDMRPAGRFAGTEPEPREGLRSGHVPGSRNVPYADLVDLRTGLVIDDRTLARVLVRAGVDPGKRLVGTCGSGTSACAFAWKMACAGHRDVPIYDGSWSEWGGREDLPVETGPPEGSGRREPA